MCSNAAGKTPNGVHSHTIALNINYDAQDWLSRIQHLPNVTQCGQINAKLTQWYTMVPDATEGMASQLLRVPYAIQSILHGDPQLCPTMLTVAKYLLMKPHCGCRSQV